MGIDGRKGVGERAALQRAGGANDTPRAVTSPRLRCLRGRVVGVAAAGWPGRGWRRVNNCHQMFREIPLGFMVLAQDTAKRPPAFQDYREPHHARIPLPCPDLIFAIFFG